MTFAIIGNGAIAGYVIGALGRRGHSVAAQIVRTAPAPEGPVAPVRVTSVADLPESVRHVIDCAGHPGLVAHGERVLRAGLDLTTLSLGALADPALADALSRAAEAGQSRLFPACGAIGALDALTAARIGRLDRVTYVGRKPPAGWAGSAAESVLDLAAMGPAPVTHFRGTARAAAVAFPKNANVAAAVALAGLGFDATQVELIADPAAARNIHEIEAEGEFGRFAFRIEGDALPHNPRSSALAAMSAVATAERALSRVVI
jgi:aspartate dehydrogenase